MCDCSFKYLCENWKGKYCLKEIPLSEKIQMSKLIYGQKFFFDKTPYQINIVVGIMEDRLTYQRPDTWKITEFNLDRIVNLVV